VTEEIINKVRKEFQELKLKARANDPLVNFLKGHIGAELNFSSQLRMLPFEMVELYGSQIIQDENSFIKYFDPKYDIFLQEWNYHYLEYWKDILQLLEDYQNAHFGNNSPLEVFNKISDGMIKIGRRSLLLDPLPKYPYNIVEQKQKRLDGSEKDYRFVRCYWIDEDGEKKRMIARHVGFRFTQLEKEIADLFYNRGFAVHRQYRSEKGNIYDLIIERARMKTVVEIKMANESIFNDLFVFDELQKRFNHDYTAS
jgi:hypothetical protein